MPKRIKTAPKPDFTKRVTPELLGQAIRAKRTELKLKLREAAMLCGVSNQTFTNAENGYPNIQLNSLLFICNGLGVKLFIEPWSLDDSNDWG